MYIYTYELFIYAYAILNRTASRFQKLPRQSWTQRWKMMGFWKRAHGASAHLPRLKTIALRKELRNETPMSQEVVSHWCCLRPGLCVCCSVLQCVAVCCNEALILSASRCVCVLQCVTVCCSVLQYVAVCCNEPLMLSASGSVCVLQCVAVCCSVLPWAIDVVRV